MIFFYSFYFYFQLAILSYLNYYTLHIILFIHHFIYQCYCYSYKCDLNLPFGKIIVSRYIFSKDHNIYG